MSREGTARWLVAALALGPPAALLAGVRLARERTGPATIEIRARITQAGGWTPQHLVLEAGKPVRLRLTSEDVVHGFGVGRAGFPAVDVWPGRFVEARLMLREPGQYVFYCTRWCGPDHWRMRGTIEVAGPAAAASDVEAARAPLYVALGLDLDAPRAARVLPARRPSPQRGSRLLGSVPASYLASDDYRTHSPEDTWRRLRAEAAWSRFSGEELWDAVAALWRVQAPAATLARGAELYARNCAACHGSEGRGDGVLARGRAPGLPGPLGHGPRRPADFTDARRMLAASPALLYGKVLRGGMGTGMPNWGPILTDEETWAVVAYLWTFQFAAGIDPGAERR